MISVHPLRFFRLSIVRERRSYGERSVSFLSSNYARRSDFSFAPIKRDIGAETRRRRRVQRRSLSANIYSSFVDRRRAGSRRVERKSDPRAAARRDNKKEKVENGNEKGKRTEREENVRARFIIGQKELALSNSLRRARDRCRFFLHRSRFAKARRCSPLLLARARARSLARFYLHTAEPPNGELREYDRSTVIL